MNKKSITEHLNKMNFEVTLYPNVEKVSLRSYTAVINHLKSEQGFFNGHLSFTVMKTQESYYTSLINQFEQIIDDQSNDVTLLDNFIKKYMQMINNRSLLSSKSNFVRFIIGSQLNDARISQIQSIMQSNSMNASSLRNLDYFSNGVLASKYRDVSIEDEIKIDQIRKIRSEYEKFFDEITNKRGEYEEHYEGLISKVTIEHDTLKTEMLSNQQMLLEENKKVIEDLSIHLNSEEQKYQKIINESITKAEESISTFEFKHKESLRLEAPAKYWTDLERRYLHRSISFSIASFLVLFGTVYLLMWMYEKIPNDITNSLESGAWKSYVAFTLIASLAVYIIRTLIKMTMSSYHLHIDAKERLQLTHVYLSLITENNGSIKEEDRRIILTSIFSRAETGLLKDSSPTMPSILGSISKITNG